MPSDLPSGTVTFLFTDIEGSTRLAQEHRDQWESLRARHHEILHEAVRAHDGHVFEIVGDAFCVAFHTAAQALEAAVDAQKALQREAWGDAGGHPGRTASPAKSWSSPRDDMSRRGDISIKVRMGIHTGAAQAAHEGAGAVRYTGYLTLVLVQRVMSTAYGGQVLLSNSTAELLLRDLPSGVTLRDMKEHRLKGLPEPERLWQVTTADLLQDFPALKTLTTVPNNLPLQLSSFIGREKEIAEIKSLVAANRLVTLTGSGGVGKTRHALQAGTELLDDFPDGVWFVDLAPVSDPALVPHAVASALNVREELGRPLMTTLQEFLEARNALLLLDNCEHLLEACVQTVEALLRSCPALKILAGSREALGMTGEMAFRVASLSVPDAKRLPPLEHLADYDAVRLFAERAAASRGQFQVGPGNAEAVVQVCARLDGIPLAIELAAARVNAFSPEQIAARLDDRFKILAGKSGTALARHQTLRAVLDWSYSLLSREEQVVLQRLSIFAGGWTLEAAESVCVLDGDDLNIMDALARLVDKSLVQMTEAGGRPRYRLLETTRQYAHGQATAAGDGDAVRARHAEYFADLAERVESEDVREGFVATLSVTGEQDNILTALEWALSGQAVETGARLAAAMGHIWDWHALFALQAHWTRRARSHRQALPPEVKARVLAASARAEAIQNNMAEARPLGLEALAIFRELGNAYWVGRTLVDLVDTTVDSATEYAQAKAWQAEALAIAREGGHSRLEHMALVVLGEVARAAGDYATAKTAYEDTLRHAVQLGDSLMESIACYDLSLVHAHGKDYAPALDYARRAMQLTTRQQQDVQSAYFLTGIAGAIGALGQPENAARLYGASESLLEGLGSGLQPIDLTDCETGRLVALALIGSEKFEALLAEGRTMTLEQAVALALGPDRT